MAENEIIPRLFGDYLLTEKLGSDAIGRYYRARKIESASAFYRLRVFDAPGLATEPILIAIEQNGAVHDFLKNPSITREVELDSVEGDAFLAYREPGGRTLRDLLDAARSRPFPIPVEHALLIAEKVATGLDHAYNSLIDGERTLHGLVWPGFVEVSDEGEARLTGFGIGEGILESRRTAAVAQLLFPYLAPEVRRSGRPAKTGDVYSTAAILFEMLTGAPPPVEGAAAAVPEATLSGGSEVLPREIAQLLKTALAESPENRYENAGVLRRDLGKLLFSGRYSPSTFNLAFFLTNLFKDDIAREQGRRAEEARMDASKYPRPAVTARPPRLVATPRFGVPVSAVESPEEPGKKAPVAAILVGALVLAAVVAISIVLVRGKSAPAPVVKRAPPPAAPAPPPETESAATTPTTGMTPDQFKEEVAKRLESEMAKLQQEQRVKQQKLLAERTAALRPAPAPISPVPDEPAPKPIKVTSNIPTAANPRPAPVSGAPAEPKVARGALVDAAQVDRPPRIATVVKPEYPPLARQMHVSGTVILSVLVTETGQVGDVKVLRGAGGNMGLNQAAASAVRKWTFVPAYKDGVPVRTWFTIPIPFVI
jgi:TonB family protein